MKIVDLFAGVGGLSLGFTEQGADLVFANDFDPAASATFRANHPGVEFEQGPIENVDAIAIARRFGSSGQIDVVMGGVPCQAFSMAGVRIRESKDSEVDKRVYLFRHFLNFVRATNPKIVLIENVVGITSMLKGQVLEEIIDSLKDLGYRVDWKYLNAADFGAPQLRVRTIILANRIGVANLFPEPLVSPQQYTPVSKALINVPKLNHEPRQLTGKALERVQLIRPGQNWKDLPRQLQTKSVHSGAYGRLHPDKPARTLTTRFDTPSVGYVTHPSEDRTLTVREGARIQGFPDDFEFHGTKMEQYRQVGNAVSPYMSRAIARVIKIMLGE
jgi:DNA (cytosine-5)-methyltransferase 1